MMTIDEIRQSYLRFFAERDHVLRPSDGLVPENDPSLLFTGAGMNQFKDHFLGLREDLSRATTTQKCLRTGDLENVGVTAFHHTFFEMLGNFSFADYFKREAIAWAWEYLTEVVSLPEEKLSVTVYEEDDEAYAIWRDEIGLPETRITRLGAKANFWPSNAPEDGPNGPCGPCSEIFFDTGPERCGPECNEDCDCGKFVEIWNLVFTQYDRRDGGALEALPGKNVDTGLGFERLVAVLHGTPTAYETPLFRPIIDVAAAIPGLDYDKGGLETKRRLRRIADHVRAAVFCLAEGLKPGNEGRGYVLRRILRRAIRNGILLGIDEPFLDRLVPPVLEVMGDAFPEIREGRQNVEIRIRNEEERFRATFEQGMARLDKAIGRLEEAGETVLPGSVAFEMYDTFGFPVDLARIILQERGFDVDLDGFDAEMARQRAASRGASQMGADIFDRGPLAEIARENGATRFLGHDEDEAVSRVLAVLVDDERTDEAGDGTACVLVAAASPFYAESGGQVGDAGTIEAEDGSFAVAVERTLKKEDLHLHVGTVTNGVVRTGTEASLRVDVVRRRATERNHTATHLLHRALRGLLGTTVEQSGSLVTPDRLTFDFTHGAAMTAEQTAEIDREVNRAVRENWPVGTEVKGIDEARASGAMALFGEKYGEHVRVVSIEDYSTELCGGTHVGRTGDIGLFRIVRERSVAAGIRRIEAVTGEGAVDRSLAESTALTEASRVLGVPESELPGRLTEILAEMKELRKAATRPRSTAPTVNAEDLLKSAGSTGPLRIVAASVPGAGVTELRTLCDRIREAEPGAAICLVAAGEKNVVVVVAAGDEAVASGFDSGRAIRPVAGALGGGGGGKPGLAQGKGKDPSKVEEALAAFREDCAKQIG